MWNRWVGMDLKWLYNLFSSSGYSELLLLPHLSNLFRKIFMDENSTASSDSLQDTDTQNCRIEICWTFTVSYPFFLLT